jgi:hypothetical protein
MQMQKLPKDLKRYLALWLPPESFCALRGVDRAFRADLTNYEDYFCPRVKQLSTFEPQLEVEWVSTFEKVFFTINQYLSYSGDLYRAINSYRSLVKLVLQTPRLLKKFLDEQKEDGLYLIINLIGLFPELHDIAFFNAQVLHGFATTKDYWLNRYLVHIYRHPSAYNSFIRNGKLIAAAAYAYLHGNNDHLYLCRYLEEKYHPEQSFIDAVRNTYGKDRDAIHDLLRSLKPYELENKASMSQLTPPCTTSFDLVQALPAVTAKRNIDKVSRTRPTKENRPLPPPPPQKADPRQASAQGKRPVPLLTVRNANTAKGLTASTLRTHFVTCATNNPLHVAVQAGEYELVQFFTQNKSLNVANKNGDYPIHIAVSTGNVGVVKLLATDSNNIIVINRKGETALQLAKSSGIVEVVRILTQAEIVLDEEKNSNETMTK